MLWKCCTQYASKFGKLSSGRRTGKAQFSFQSQRKAMPKNAQIQWILEYRYFYKLLISVPLDTDPAVQLLDHILVVILIFWGTAYCFPQWLFQFTFLLTVHEGSLFSAFSPTLVLSCLFNDTVTSVRGYLISVLICISLIIRDAEHLSLYPLAICMSFSEFLVFREKCILILYFKAVDLLLGCHDGLDFAFGPESFVFSV